MCTLHLPNLWTMRTLHVLSALALAAPLAAQWNTPSVNTPVRAASGVTCDTPLCIRCGVAFGETSRP